MPADPTSSLRLVGASEAVAAPGDVLAAGMDMAYQPIVHLGSGAVIAYEALARPRHPGASNPLDFFGKLEDAGRRLDGERMAFETAMANAGRRPPRVKLFINASPLTLVDPDFDVVELIGLAEAHGVATTDLVVEVTESEAIDDLDALARCARRLRRLGIGLAVDDAGAGHASFRVITRLRPGFIKIDRDLVADVDTDGARRAFLEAMVRFARQIGSRLIAEGIETEGELACLAGLGVEAGQGYFLARPGIGQLPDASEASRGMITEVSQRLRFGAAQVSAGELVRPATAFAATMTVREAQARFAADPSLSTALIGSGERLTSVITRRGLERFLGTPGTWEHFADRPVTELADHHPLSVVSQLDLLEVGTILGARQSHEVGDDVVVTDPRGGVVGVLSVTDVLRVLSVTRQHSDRDVHPLSGLLGPAWVEEELARRCENGEAATVALVDLDQFSLVNELSGFALGDELIRRTGRCLAGVCGGVDDAAVAHMGGDDFVILVPPQGYEELVGELVRSFETEVVPFLRVALRLRQCEDVSAVVSLSIAATDLSGVPPTGHRHLDWASGCLRPLQDTAKRHGGYSAVHHSGNSTIVSTWTPRNSGTRRVSVGQSEPGVVLEALATIDRAWRVHWEQLGESDDERLAEGAFPGPRSFIEQLQRDYAVPLAAAARAALEAGDAVMEVTITGEEAEVIELLDRVAVVTQSIYALRKLPIPPELSLLDRLLRQRARVIVRRDVVSRTEVGRGSDGALAQR